MALSINNPDHKLRIISQGYGDYISSDVPNSLATIYLNAIPMNKTVIIECSISPLDGQDSSFALSNDGSVVGLETQFNDKNKYVKFIIQPSSLAGSMNSVSYISTQGTATLFGMASELENAGLYLLWRGADGGEYRISWLAYEVG